MKGLSISEVLDELNHRWGVPFKVINAIGAYIKALEDTANLEATSATVGRGAPLVKAKRRKKAKFHPPILN